VHQPAEQEAQAGQLDEDGGPVRKACVHLYSVRVGHLHSDVDNLIMTGCRMTFRTLTKKTIVLS
jgi:Cu/Ag efflux protein CusF